jgi:hypothetical protein
MGPKQGALHDRCCLGALAFQAAVISLRRGVFQMAQFFEGSERRLAQISVDLLNRMAEIQKLRELIAAAETSRLSRGQSATDRSVTIPPVGNELRA